MLYMSKKCLNHHAGYPEKRWGQFLILRVLYEKPTYGYKVAELVEELTEGRYKIKLGTVYTLLRRMEENNFLNSEWKESDQTPDKKIYKVTKKGERALRAWLEIVVERREMMKKMTDFYKKHFENKNNDK